MGIWQKLINRKKVQKEQPNEDWEEISFEREGVDFHSEEQRTRYVTECLEQIALAAREMDKLSGEYTNVTEHLMDIEEIEALPPEERETVDFMARKLQTLEREREELRNNQNHMSDADYYRLRRQESELAEGIEKLKEAERYQGLIRQDLKRIDREKQAYQYRRQELQSMMNNLRGMAVIFLTALAACIVMLLVLQFAFQMETIAGYFLAVMAAAISVTVLCVKYLDADRETLRVERSIVKLVQLQNKVKIRYVNNTNLLEYLYMKYSTDSAARLEKLWQRYRQEKEERQQFAEVEAKMEYYRKEFVKQLTHYQLHDPLSWQNQSGALLDKREMVEIRHELILRRQALRKQMDYNTTVAGEARSEVLGLVRQYPRYAKEIQDMIDRYEHI